MLTWTQGDILTSETEALVNTVNCVGVMGRGIALQFKRRFPENFKAYAAACKRGEVEPGRMFVFETGRIVPPQFVINFPTKRHWRAKSRIEDIKAGLDGLVGEIKDRKIKSIAIPPLGSGLGGLDWGEVRRLIETALGGLEDVSVVVFEPGGVPVELAGNKGREAPRMTPGRAALVGLMNCYLRGLAQPDVSLLEVHKLLYFLQNAGQPLRLNYVRGHYGPYAENLRHVLQHVEGHLIRGYKDGGDEPGKALELVPGATKEAKAFIDGDQELRRRFERVVQVVAGFETPFGLELLATVHMVLAQSPNLPDNELEAEVYAWNNRKRQFSPEQLRIARRRLQELGWIASEGD